MEINILNQLRNELESFNLVMTANLFGAATAIAFIIAHTIVIFTPIITGTPFDFQYLPYLIVIICTFATAVSLRIRNAELMDEYNKIVNKLDTIIKVKIETDEQDFDEQFIGIILESLSFYRENNRKINRLKWIGRLTGTFLLIAGVSQFISFINTVTLRNPAYLLAHTILIAISIGVTIVAWYIPTVINRFMQTWDARLKLAEDANTEIKRFLEDNS